jgi:type IV pilus assembly protein PilQ
VTPQINSQGFIRLTVEPEISSDKGETPVTFGAGSASSASIPVIQTQKIKTQVSLRDGYTLGLGGLIKDESSTSRKSLPFFGSIPLVGHLFGKDNNTTDRSNLLIFITAKIVSAESAKVEEIFDSRVVREHNLRRSDISGHRDHSDPFLPEVSVEPVVKNKKK